MKLLMTSSSALKMVTGRDGSAAPFLGMFLVGKAARRGGGGGGLWTWVLEDWDDVSAVKLCGCFSSILTAEMLREGIWGSDDGAIGGLVVREGKVKVDERKEEEKASIFLAWILFKEANFT